MTDDGQRDKMTEHTDHLDDVDRDERVVTLSRKALLKAGSAVPVAMAVAPAAAFAASPAHTDHLDATVHVDA
jgi:hypothetical protein